MELMGAGRTELMECLLGLQEYSGDVKIAGHKVPAKMDTSERIKLGICLVPEDRKKNGIFPISSVSNNMTISSLWRRLKHRFSIDEKAEAEAVTSAIGDLSIKVSSPDIEIRALSGGNQQKVVIGRTLLTSPKVLLLDEPTRGIDIGAKGDVFNMMVTLSEQGIGVLFSTSDLKEIMAVSDRILVMSGGKLTANILRSEATESALVSASAQGL
ncbi:ATP-binding cassette domain-containing protein [Marinomonas sp. RS-M-Aa-14]|uniref:ATP-binding cassette domain-containing protein n=1 Tax=Marinomonas sp. RS-M-Aa-14 TaxID=3241169 RepID=UPI003AAB57E1